MSPAAAPTLAGAGAAPLVRRLAGFARLARDNGFRIGVRETLDALTFAQGGALLDSRALRWGLRALLCSCQSDWARFDELFDAYWLRAGMRGALRRIGGPAAGGADDGAAVRATRFGPAEALAVPAEGRGGRQGGASATESLARTDFRLLSDDAERQALADLAERLAARMRWRLTRRHRLRSRGRRVDLRRTIHRSLGQGGLPLRLAFRKRRLRPVRLVVLLDASGSMSPYSSFFLAFVRGIVGSFDRAEAFAFHTRLVHLSAALGERDPQKATARLSVMSQGWGGGTRIGHCLARFNDNHAASVLGARSAVMILSDGYDTGPPELLAREMRRLRRRAKRIIWLNPLLGWQGYEPVARGMTAALPFVDLFAPAHNLESLIALEPHLHRL